LSSLRVKVGDFQIEENDKRIINEVLDSGRISEGQMVREFEKEFAEFVGTKEAVALSSGSSALIAGMTALTYSKEFDIKPNTNVITTPLTYIATSSAIVRSGFNPVYVDVDRENFVVTPENIKMHLENVDDVNNYSLILPVHLMGYPCDMNEINRIAEKYGLQTFEDSAQAHGTVYKGKKVGSLSLLSDFSFYVAHTLSAGEMGAITTNNEDVADKVRKIKVQGTGEKFIHDMIGYNFKTTEIQAAIAISQLRNVERIIKKRQQNVKYLNEFLENLSDILQLPQYSDDVSYLAYPLVIKKPEKITRKNLTAKLEKSGVETRPLFGCIPLQQPSFSYLRDTYKGKLPFAEYLGKNAFYIGCHQYLEQEDLEFTVTAFQEIMKSIK
jgi:perosamine synthetase